MKKKKTTIKIEKCDYDHPLKLIFLNPLMMKDLIRGFVPEKWVKELDFSTLKKVCVAHVTDDLRTRDNDCIWQLNFREQPFFIICLTEFQSDVDDFMAVRILTYVGLIYQDLIRSGELTKKDKLPPIFSLVYYTGEKKWDAPLNLHGHLNPAIPPGLMRYQPQIEYRLLHVTEISIADNPHLSDNLVSPLIELEQVYNPTHLNAVFAKIAELFQGEEFHDLRRHILSYIIKATKLHEKFPEIDLYELHEGNIMLSARLDRWEEKLRQEVRQEGRQEGRLETRHEERLSIAKMLVSAKYEEIPKKILYDLEKFSDDELKTFITKMIHEKHEEISLD